MSLSRSTLRFLVFCVCLLRCSNPPSTGETNNSNSHKKADISDKKKEKAAAIVDGAVISLTAVEELINSVDGGLSAKEALNILIRNELLAGEAKRRGYDKLKEIEYVKQIELARTLLRKKISDGIKAENLDIDRLRDLYNANKPKYVHGRLRKVTHILVQPDSAASAEVKAVSIANQIANQAKAVSSLSDFKTLGNTFEKKYPKRIKTESLPPFSKDTERFVASFVKATFAIPETGSTSTTVKTNYGWHIIYLEKEFPAENRSFEEVVGSLKNGVLPIEKQIKAKELIEGLRKKTDVFVFDNHPNNETIPNAR